MKYSILNKNEFYNVIDESTNKKVKSFRKLAMALKHMETLNLENTPIEQPSSTSKSATTDTPTVVAIKKEVKSVKTNDNQNADESFKNTNLLIEYLQKENSLLKNKIQDQDELIKQFEQKTIEFDKKEIEHTERLEQQNQIAGYIDILNGEIKKLKVEVMRLKNHPQKNKK